MSNAVNNIRNSGSFRSVLMVCVSICESHPPDGIENAVLR